MEISVTETASSVLFNYQATLRGYEPPEPIGYGKTKLEAISNLLEELEQ